MDVTKAQLRRFKTDRRTRAIDAHGRRKGDPDYFSPKPVGDRALEADLKALRSVLEFGIDEGLISHTVRRLFGRKRGVRIPKNPDPKRPVMPKEHHRALLEVAPEIHPYLEPMIVVAAAYGKRRSAICQLRVEDVDFESGRITFRAETDKKGTPWEGDLYPVVREALAAHLGEQGVRAGWLFPAPRDPTSHLDPDLAGKWLGRVLRKAEKRHSLRRIPGLGWHAYRRWLATHLAETPGLSHDAIAKAIGWRDTDMLKVYVQSDRERADEAMRRRAEGL